MIKSWSKEGAPTLRELCQKFAAARGHFAIVGTPKDVADEMQKWFEAGACDGFNLVPSYFPGGLDDFVEMVVPELQRRGIYRTAYEGTTLRENLEIPRPESRHAAPADKRAAAAS
jgi:alkanesulfonate monooxygenase